MLRRSKGILILSIFLSSLVFPQQELSEGINYFARREWLKAVDFFSRSLKANPNSMLSYHYLGAALLESGRNNEAYLVLKDGASRFPNEKSIVGNFINTGLITGKTDEPLKAGVRYLKKYPAEKNIRILTAAAYSKQAEFYLNAGQYSAAHSSARAALGYNSADENAFTVLVRNYILTGKAKEAKSEAERAMKILPGSLAVQTVYLAALNASQEFEKALELAIKLNKFYKDDADFQMQLGFLYRANYKLQDGSALFERLVNKFPSTEKVYDGAITFFESLSQYDKVRTLYNAKIKAFGREKEFSIKIAESYDNEKLPSKARDVYLKMLEKKDESDIRMLLAVSYIEGSVADSAIMHLKNILISDSVNYEANKLLCRVYLEGKTHPEFSVSAIAFYKNHNKDFTANYYFSLSHLINSDYLNASRYADSARKISPSSPFPFSVLAETARKNSDSKGAKFYAKQSLLKALIEIEQMESSINKLLSDAGIENSREKNRKAASLKKELADLQNAAEQNFRTLRELSDPEELRYTLNSIILRHPDNPLVSIEKGDFHKRKNELDSALYFYKLAIRGNPMLSASHNSLAEVYAKKGDYPEAIRSLKRALSADQNNPSVYDRLIEYSLKNGSAGELADDWIKVYKTDKKNIMLRERLIEALHKTNRFDDANKIIRDINE